MAKHIGIVACSAEGAALCYRTICQLAAARLGEHQHPEITMHTYPLARYMKAIHAGDWEQVAGLMISSTRKLHSCGAEIAICPDNTVHQAFELVAATSPLPWLHIAEEVARQAEEMGCTRLAVTGTNYLMEGPVYPAAAAKFQLDCELPLPADRRRIDRIIFKELVNGICSEQSRLYLNQVIQQLRQRGCEAVVLGCTELPLLVDPADCPLPVLDSTRILAKAALTAALS
ncbi:MAG: amino acid racemase [Candidatus Delongbacteria bacterium]|nr:amino acid racemase [Candidatus Delongbacteria bacterium]